MANNDLALLVPGMIRIIEDSSQRIGEYGRCFRKPDAVILQVLFGFGGIPLEFEAHWAIASLPRTGKPSADHWRWLWLKTGSGMNREDEPADLRHGSWIRCDCGHEVQRVRASKLAPCSYCSSKNRLLAMGLTAISRPGFSRGGS